MHRRCTGGVVLALAVTLALPSLATAQPVDRQELRQQLTPLYHQLRTDPTFDALRQAVEQRMDHQPTVDRLLEHMPISPLEYHKIDMFVNRYELVTPKRLFDWHIRWVELHRSRAESQYGRDYVRSLLGGGSAALGGVGDGAAVARAATVDTNRNAAADFAPNTPEDYQGEVQVVVNPNDPSQIVAATNTWDVGMQSVFYSSDGGVTWGHTFPPTGTDFGLGSCNRSQFGSDPALHWDDNGVVYLEYMALCSSFFSTDYAIVVARSTDGGATWSPQGVVIDSWGTNDLEDKEFYAIDNNPGSPFYGRHYTCWDRNNDERFAYSTDQGQSWTEVDLPDVSIDLGCEMAVEDDGTVHLVWDTLSCGQSCSNEQMYYTRSANGGVSWSSPVLVRDFNLVGFSNTNCPDAQDDRCIGPFGAIDVDNTSGACDGTLYVTFTDYGPGEDVNASDVWVTTSTSNGSSWSAPVKVNDDGLADRVQFHPFLEVDQTTGDVVVGWHDARNDAGNDAIDYYVARSTDCGATFEANVQASAASGEFNNSSISYSNLSSADNPGYNPNQYGEYMGVDAHGGKAYLAWSDSRHYFPSFTNESQAENLGFTVVQFGPPPECGNGVKESGEECDGADLGGASCSDFGCSTGSIACNADCTLDTSACSECVQCGNGVCEQGEDCTTCSADCISGSGASCGNGVCETANGEDCLSCPSDCNGVQNGRPSGRYCCGDGDGQNPVGCGDSRCTSGGFDCTADPVAGSCCGDLVCEGIEDSLNCELDCGAPPSCGDGSCDSGEDSCSCAADCGSPPGSELVCDDGLDEDCDGDVDCADTDCGADPACSTAFCGDGSCDSGEDPCSCATDCGAPPTSESVCDDSFDEDCDGDVDCADADCSADPACSTSCVGSGGFCTADGECCSGKCRLNGAKANSCT